MSNVDIEALRKALDAMTPGPYGTSPRYGALVSFDPQEVANGIAEELEFQRRYAPAGATAETAAAHFMEAYSGGRMFAESMREPNSTGIATLLGSAPDLIEELADLRKVSDLWAAVPADIRERILSAALTPEEHRIGAAIAALPVHEAPAGWQEKVHSCINAGEATGIEPPIFSTPTEAAELEALRTLRDEVWNNPAAWMRWCDEHLVAENERLNAEVGRLLDRLQLSHADHFRRGVRRAAVIVQKFAPADALVLDEATETDHGPIEALHSQIVDAADDLVEADGSTDVVKEYDSLKAFRAAFVSLEKTSAALTLHAAECDSCRADAWCSTAACLEDAAIPAQKAWAEVARAAIDAAAKEPV